MRSCLALSQTGIESRKMIKNQIELVSLFILLNMDWVKCIIKIKLKKDSMHHVQRTHMFECISHYTKHHLNTQIQIYLCRCSFWVQQMALWHWRAHHRWPAPAFTRSAIKWSTSAGMTQFLRSFCILCLNFLCSSGTISWSYCTAYLGQCGICNYRIQEKLIQNSD